MSDVREFRNRLYESYATTHAGLEESNVIGAIAERDFVPYLPSDREGARILDIGCGQGALVAALCDKGFTQTMGVDVSPEQVRIAHDRGLDQVHLGDLSEWVGADSEPWSAILATDVLEHLDRTEVLDVFDKVRSGLVDGGRFIARVPNALSPFGGAIRYGDFTHETWFTARSVQQLSRAAGFSKVDVLPCRPVVHGAKSVVRSVVWRGFEGLMRAAYAAETGAKAGAVFTQNLTFIAYA